ncbi:MAG: hypothetical protein ACR2ON_09900 [Paracoccaceae bacterium]
MATLKDVVSQLQENAKETKAVNDNMSKLLQMEIDRAKGDKVAAADAVAEARKVKAAPRPADRTQGNRPADFAAGLKGGLGLGGLGTGLLASVRTFIPTLVGTVVGGVFGAGALATLGTGIGTIVKKGLIFGAAYGLIETFGEKIITSLFTKINEEGDFKIDPLVIQGLAEKTKNGVIDGLALGLIFGKKGFFAGFVGSVILGGLKSAFPKITEANWKENAKILGFEIPISKELFVQAGATIAAFFGPGLILGALRSAFGGAGAAAAVGGATVGRDAKTGRFTKLSKTNSSKFRLGFSRGGALASVVLFAAGEALSSYVEGEFGSTAGNVTSWVTQGAALGAMFGPKGALVGAIAGLAIGGGAALFDWLKKKDQEVREAAIARANEAIDASRLEDGTISGANMNEEQIQMVKVGDYERRRAEQLHGADMEFLAAEGAKYEQVFSTYRNQETGVLSPKGIDRLFSEGFMEGDRSKLIRGAIEIIKRPNSGYDRITPENVAEIIEGKDPFGMSFMNDLMKSGDKQKVDAIEQFYNSVVGSDLDMLLAADDKTGFLGLGKRRGEKFTDEERREFATEKTQLAAEIAALIAADPQGMGKIINIFNTAPGSANPAAPSVLTLGSDQTTSQDAYYSHGLFGRGSGASLATP